MGKSSIIQALLLLRQSYVKGTLNKNGLALNGELVEIGTGKDALFQNAETDQIIFELLIREKQTQANYQWKFEYSADSDILPYDTEMTPQNLDSISLFSSTNFQYLNAERLVRNQYERSDLQVVKNRSLGKNGEFMPHYLEYYGSEEIHSALIYPNTNTNTLEAQVSAWLNEISPGTKVKMQKLAGVNAMKLGYEFETNDGASNEFTATNVGFGITYTLSVIVALLSARAGDILIIENPESHVHPQGQSAIGRLIAMVAGLGVQVFIESHSDHILNGICVALHRNYIRNQDVKFYFFQKKEREIASYVYEAKVDQNGRIDDSVLQDAGLGGYFDQINKDLNEILFTPSN